MKEEISMDQVAKYLIDNGFKYDTSIDGKIESFTKTEKNNDKITNLLSLKAEKLSVDEFNKITQNVEIEKEDILNTNACFNYPEFYDKISKNEDYKTFVELGSFKGHSIIHLAQALNNRNNINIFAIDAWDEDNNTSAVNNNMHEVPQIHGIYKQNIKNANLRNKPTDIKSLSWDAARSFIDKSVDFLFIDAGHSYEDVKKDLHAWLPKMKKGSTISGHDYYNPCGVKQAVDEEFGDKVKHHLEEWCGEHVVWYVEL